MQYLCEESQTIIFPFLYNENKEGKVRRWRVLIKLVKPGADHQVPFKTEYLESFPGNLHAVYWTETGYINGKLMKSDVTISTPTNIGKKNFRNPLKQAISVVQSKIAQKEKEGFSECLTPESKDNDPLWFPMLAMNYEEHKKSVRFPCFIQPKLDGVRCLITLISGNTVAYTRTRKEYSTRNQIICKITSAVYPTLERLCSTYGQIFLDGELFRHNLKLQDINHYTRKLSHDVSNDDPGIQFHVFDIIVPSKLDEFTFEKRFEIMKNIEQTNSIRVVSTFVCENQIEVDKHYKSFLDQGYEGAMIRSKNGLYASSCDSKSKLRSKELLKYKPVFTDEYPITGFTAGSNGKEINSIIWICETNEKISFKVTPNETYQKRRVLYDECRKQFSEKYQHRLLCVEYRGKSRDNVPLHCKGLYIRDVE